MSNEYLFFFQHDYTHVCIFCVYTDLHIQKCLDSSIHMDKCVLPCMCTLIYIHSSIHICTSDAHTQLSFSKAVNILFIDLHYL